MVHRQMEESIWQRKRPWWLTGLVSDLQGIKFLLDRMPDDVEVFFYNGDLSSFRKFLVEAQEFHAASLVGEIGSK